MKGEIFKEIDKAFGDIEADAKRILAQLKAINDSFYDLHRVYDWEERTKQAEALMKVLDKMHKKTQTIISDQNRINGIVNGEKRRIEAEKLKSKLFAFARQKRKETDKFKTLPREIIVEAFKSHYPEYAKRSSDPLKRLLAEINSELKPAV